MILIKRQRLINWLDSLKLSKENCYEGICWTCIKKEALNKNYVDSLYEYLFSFRIKDSKTYVDKWIISNTSNTVLAAERAIIQYYGRKKRE